MKVKVKLLDRNLIRSFGGVIQMMEAGKANRFVEQGKAVFDDPAMRKKMQYGPPQNKAIFQSPEDKLMQDFDNHRFPGRDDKLFPTIRKRK
jgi:hypothetical protein